jgi:uncharacterized protein YjiS (DUF1127 family)
MAIEKNSQRRCGFLDRDPGSLLGFPRWKSKMKTIITPLGGSDHLLVRALAERKALLRRIAEWQRCAAGRRELMTLTDRDLHDIGIGRSEAEAEAKKPFWET